MMTKIEEEENNERRPVDEVQLSNQSWDCPELSGIRMFKHPLFAAPKKLIKNH